MTGTLFCFGFGYSADALASTLLAEGWKVRGTATTPAKVEALRSRGIAAHVFDGQAPLAGSDRALEGVTHVLCSIPPDADGDPVVRHHGRELMRLRSLRWAALLSTTGVYGDRQGGTVDEDSELRPTSERSVRRVVAERQWLALWRSTGVPVHIFRLAGIYGPGRNPLDQIRAGQARRIVKPGLVLGRIHRDDIVGALRASIERRAAGSIYNVTDDEPVAPWEITAHGCTLLGVAPPPEVPHTEAEMSPLLREFYADNKRVSNRRLHEQLGYRFRFPTYREGLKALLAEPPATPRRGH
ncbi:MAG: SDR family oxidoreductase [Alphaproteobacteria bacterium]|nr:SDR family oxidoreductase [Alphaproteobacteria bacterium]